MKHSWNFLTRFQHHLSITGVSKVDEPFPAQLFFQHPNQVWHFFVEVIILFTFISLVVCIPKHSYPFLALVVPTGTYSYFISFLLSMHGIKCQGAALNPPPPFSLLDIFKYFLCALHRQLHTLLPVLSYYFLFREFYTYWCLLQVGSCSCFYYFFFFKFLFWFSVFPGAGKIWSVLFSHHEHRHSS